MSLSNFLENALINWAFNGETMPTRPTAWYIAVHTEDPTDDGSAGELVVGDDTGFVRKSVTFGAASGGQSVSTASVAWNPTGTGPWTVTHVSIWDALTAGNCLITGALLIAKEVSDTKPLAISSGDLVAALD